MFKGAHDYYVKYPHLRNLNFAFCHIKELVEECDQWVATAVTLVRSSKNRTASEILDWLEEMAIRCRPRVVAAHKLYAKIELLYRAALPPMPIPSADFTLAEGQEGFCIM